jgi:hypothetical protein
MAASSDKGINKRIDKGTDILNSVRAKITNFLDDRNETKKKESPNSAIWVTRDPNNRITDFIWVI